MSEQKELTVGWGNPRPYSNASRFHYFGADGRSLCGKWAKFGTHIDSDEMDEHPDNCSICKKRVALMRSAALSVAARKETT